jgi:hypothetical protein
MSSSESSSSSEMESFEIHVRVDLTEQRPREETRREAANGAALEGESEDSRFSGDKRLDAAEVGGRVVERKADAAEVGAALEAETFDGVCGEAASIDSSGVNSPRSKHFRRAW